MEKRPLGLCCGMSVKDPYIALFTMIGRTPKKTPLPRLLGLILAVVTLLWFSQLYKAEFQLRTLWSAESVNNLYTFKHQILQSVGPFTIKLQEKYQFRPARARSPKEKRLAAQICGDGPRFVKWYEQGSDKRALKDEDKILYENFFQHAGNDMNYLEIGGYDGMSESVSRFYDLCLGWKGVLIEANPMLYGHMSRNRPYADRLSFAATCDSNRNVPFAKVQWSDAAQLEGTKNYYADLTSKHVQVPCGNLTPVIQGLFPVSRVNLMILDVSGAEHLVLANMDFDLVAVDVLVVDTYSEFCSDEDCEVRRQVQATLQKAGYLVVTNLDLDIGVDVYVHPQSKHAPLGNPIQLGANS